MRILILLLLTLSMGAAETWMTHVRDQHEFVTEAEAQGGQRTVIAVAKALLSLRCKAEIAANFTIATVDWGHQVNFNSLRVLNQGLWSAVPEGFGEVYVSRDGSRVKMDVGP